MKKVMIIINPTSGGETALDYKESLENKAKEYFDYVETKITQKAKDATQFAEKASKEKYDAVIVFGGDGTVNEVISGIAEKNHIPKLGIIPGGTGNLIKILIKRLKNLISILLKPLMLEKLIKIILAIFLVLDLYQKLFITLILKIKQSTVSLHMQSIR